MGLVLVVLSLVFVAHRVLERRLPAVRTEVGPVAYVATYAVFFSVVNWLKGRGPVAAVLLDASGLALAPIAVLLVGCSSAAGSCTAWTGGVFEHVVLVLLAAGAVHLLVGQ